MARAYDIRYFGDAGIERAVVDAAPDWLLVNADDGTMILFLKRGEVCPEVLLEAWAAYRALEATPQPHVPAQQRRPPIMRALLSAGLLAAGFAEGASMLANTHTLHGII